MAEGPRDPAAAREAVRELAEDLRAWLEWAALTGADGMPAPEPAPRAAAARPPARPPEDRRPTAPPPARPPGSRAPTGPPPARVAPSPAPERPALRVIPGGQGAPGAGGETLQQVRADLGECTRCPLHEGRKHIVFGVGSPQARLVVVGEAPGFHEDRVGEPFVGRAGQLLTRMLAAIRVPREHAYICNVLKCRPPDNRDPLPPEVAACSPFLRRQIEAIGPRAILTVGRFAAQVILGLDEPMGRLRGEVRSYQGVPVVATYHPAYLLRSPAAKADAWQDLLRVRALVHGA